MVLKGNNPPANAGDMRHGFNPLGWEDPLEKEVATHSSILARKIQRTEELVDCSPWGFKELDVTEQLNMYAHRHKARSSS